MENQGRSIQLKEKEGGNRRSYKERVEGEVKETLGKEQEREDRREKIKQDKVGGKGEKGKRKTEDALIGCKRVAINQKLG